MSCVEKVSASCGETVEERYEIGKEIGEGSFGRVFQGRCMQTGKQVALKEIKEMVFSRGKQAERDDERDQEERNDERGEEEGFPIELLREIRHLRQLRHPNVLSANEVLFSASGSLFLVLPRFPDDLGSLLSRRTRLQEPPLPPAESRALLRQLLAGVTFLHSRGIAHRDIKPENLLLSDRALVIGDLGTARGLCGAEEAGAPLSPDVSTLSYRAPEMLFGSERYGVEVDVWACGCVMGHLATGKPLFKPRGELDQILQLCELLGSPSIDNWPGLPSLPVASRIRFPEQPLGKLRARVSEELLQEPGFSLLQAMLTYDPAQRIPAASALSHPYFDAL